MKPKRTATVAAIGISLIVWTSVAAQDMGNKQIAARTELHPIQSLTLSDEQFLKGDGGGKQVTVSGQIADRTGHRSLARRRDGSWLGRHRAQHRYLVQGV